MYFATVVVTLIVAIGDGFTVGGIARYNFKSGASRFMNLRDSGRRKHSVIESFSPEASDESGSVHLQLNKDSQQSDADASAVTTDDAEDMNVIIEYIRCNDSAVVLAAVATQTPYNLELFSLHVFGSNYSTVEGMKLNMKTINLRDTEDVKVYEVLWRQGLLLSPDTHFPTFETKKDRISPGPEILKGQVTSLVRRFKSILDGMKRDEEVFTDFLISNDLMKFQRNENLNRNETLAVLKSFAVWFKAEFPYYYEKCSHCNKVGGNTFYGHVIPTQAEQKYEAGRTELYHCSNASCLLTFRFPRYNDVSKVLETRKGRCGEYSVLMLRLLKSLGYEGKWVVDWADHVWCEVYVPYDDDNYTFGKTETNRELPQFPLEKIKIKTVENEDKTFSPWTHIDPCEAAVDENYIYESWGKSQNYIISVSSSRVKDVTEKYTNRFNETTIRRLEKDVHQTYVETLLHSAEADLRNYTKC